MIDTKTHLDVEKPEDRLRTWKSATYVRLISFNGSPGISRLFGPYDV